ncbi:hypothetical protein CkaCkLH20_05689 [Colletotrichum karsti]|uniref:Short-chain dehydrogenase n=1 Tax=Colletotrichum karsti TaxID=1095194 RepID=A0A9P6I5M9_9PEZI|nr:uncharacterized protein CkaCkLH20_05689 [Colletotrichum karsti]KAF9876843.1 hypothetical protein CkaCkLH20_05689 [Colletotrichum karsti]
MATYAKDHENPNGPGDARPTALKIIRDQDLDDKLTGKVFLVTGCTSGIGVETARALHVAGADVYITGRDVKAGQRVIESITQDKRDGKVGFIEMHLDSLASVAEGIEAFKKHTNLLNGLICNAGVAFHPKATTTEGFETHFGVNHVAHFALFLGVQEMLLKSATAEFPSRVTMVSSSAHRVNPVNLDDYNLTKCEYDPTKAYGASKTANIWMVNVIERMYGHKHLHANSVHPGGIHTLGARHLEDSGEKLFKSFYRIVKSPEQGAATTVWAAVGKDLEGRGGLYLADVQVGVLSKDPEKDRAVGYASHAFDEGLENQLWELSRKFVFESGKFPELIRSE